MYLTFRAFRAINDIDTCLKFVEEHRNVLKDYGITNITTNTDEWMHNSNIYCIIAESVIDKKIIGGVRLQLSGLQHKLPVELAIGEMDRNIYKIIENYRNNGGIAELCALWNAKAVAGVGVSLLLVRAAVALANQLKIVTLVCICADYTLKMFQQVGFVVNNSLGLQGEFPYPNATYTARVLGLLNVITFGNAHEYDKQRIQSLCDQPNQQIKEKGTYQDIMVDYNLIIDKKK
jgi:hypothetical protein